MHKKDTPLRPVLSTPGIPYHNLNKVYTPLFEQVPGANMETFSLQAREKLENIKFDENDQIVFLDVKSLYTNIPVSETIEIALRSLYSSDNAPEIEQSTLRLLLNLAITNAHFISIEK